MFFKQFVHESLGHASYLVGSEQTGQALVLDVRRDVDTYFELAQKLDLSISYAADTHQHNDYLSGICELPQRADVKLLAGARAELGYPVKKMNDGERLEMGEVVFEVMHTPGHTPEHISLLITDRSRGEEPAMLLSGGALLVGDVARPDLLGGEEETKRGAAAFCETLRNKILELPDHVEVYPTHVAGSLCGGNIGSRYSTTIGYERKLNGLLASLSSSEQFEKQCLDLKDLPAVPPYWRRMRRQNAAGPEPIGVLGDPPALQPEAFEKRLKDGAWVLDCRAPEAFGGGHIPGSVNVGVGSSFPTWAGTILPPDVAVLLVLDRASDLWTVCWELLRIGYDLPVGWLAGGIKAWRTSARDLELLPQLTVWDLRRLIEKEDVFVLDVRQPGEWSEAHIEQAHHITGAELPERLSEVPQSRPVATVCGSGFRSSVAASLLQHAGYERVHNVLGGMTAWQNAGYPTAA